MMFGSSGHMRSCAVWKSFNQLSTWWLLCKRYAYTLIRVSRHYYVIRMFLLCLCIFVSNKAFWSWSWSCCCLHSLCGRTSYRKVSWSLEAGFGDSDFRFRRLQPLWNLTGTSAAALPRCLSNLEPYDHYNIHSRGFETSRDLAVGLINSLDNFHLCEGNKNFMVRWTG